MQKTNPMSVKIFTDGGCLNNPGEGGIGVILRYQEHIKKINGYVPLTTNNQMELLAIIVALEHLKKPCEVAVYTDSKYLQNGITEWIKKWKNNNWKTANKQNVKNQSLWVKLDELVNVHKITFEWIKGHSGHYENEMADELCKIAINNKSPLLSSYLHLLET